MRGMQLKTLGRYADAERLFLEALAENPNDAFVLHQLAICQLQIPTSRKQALDSIRRAIALEPNEAEHFSVEAFVLCASHRAKEALPAARQALALDPYSGFAFTALAQAHAELAEWKEAEAASRQALALDADNSLAANQLAQALRLQNKLAETEAHIGGMLARDPEDPFTHANAGWAALQQGKHKAACGHFLEALRLNPDFEHAREGLLSSFRARSPIYRGYLQYTFWMQRLVPKARWAVIIGLYLALNFSRRIFATSHPLVGIGIALVYFLFVLWVWVAKGVGNFILLFDSFARCALRRNEKIEALFVGGGLIGGILLFATGFAINSIAPIVLGTALVAAAFPFSLTFTNSSRKGSVLFGAIGAGMLAVSFLYAIQVLFPAVPKELASQAFFGGLIACLGCTWLGNIPALRR